MRDLNPEIYRQRLIVEGYYTVEIGEDFVKELLRGLAEELGMRVIGGPYVFSCCIHRGFGAFMAWEASGVALYTWSDHRFFTLDVYTCKPFDVATAVKYAVKRLGCDKFTYQEVGYES